MPTGKKYQSLKQAMAAGYQPEAGVPLASQPVQVVDFICGRRKAEQMFQRGCLPRHLNQWPGDEWGWYALVGLWLTIM